MQTLSVVIPAYNEERYIGCCLDHLLNQICDIDEIIVVNNASTDLTAHIVTEYSVREPKIRLVSEPQKGLIHARNTGFSASSCDIIGRIDADTRVVSTWAMKMKEFFECRDHDSFGAITGLSAPYDSPFQVMRTKSIRALVDKGLWGNNRPIEMLHGANMAIRRSTWDAVRSKTTLRRDIHEDIDLALCIIASGEKIAESAEIWATVSPRRALMPPLQYTRVTSSGLRSFELHGRSSWVLKWVQAPQNWILHAALWPAYKAYNADNEKYSLKKLFAREDFRDACV